MRDDRAERKQMMPTPFAALANHKIVPVVTTDSAEQGLEIALALARGGLPVAEITFRTPAAADVIRAIRDSGPRAPDEDGVGSGADVLVGAGTIVRPDQVDAAVAAGAHFVVSPGLSRAVVERCHEHGIPIIPGAVTATEIQAAIELGVQTVKFFPAETSGGAAAIRALTAPFAEVGFMPTGGVGPANLGDYLSIAGVVAAGGSWMLPAASITRGDTDDITRLTREAVELAARYAPVGLR